MKALRVRYRATYRLGKDEPGKAPLLIVTGDATIPAAHVEEAKRISYAGYLLCQMKPEMRDGVLFDPEKVEIVFSMEIEESVCPK